MSVIVRLQNLPWAANAVDIRQYFHGLAIPEGGVHIVGGELGDAFIAFSTDEDARQAMLRDGGKIKEIKIKLYLSSRAEMQKIIDQARQQSLGMQQFMTMPTMPQMSVPVTNIGVPNMPVPNVTMPNVPGMQVPLQNVPNVSAMVSHMVSKQEENSAIAPPAPPVGMLPMQPEPAPPVAATTSVTTTTTSTSNKVDSEKDKKDKRRRRTRSHSRDQSDSRSRSRSTSRSRSRSKDRKGRDRDRYYDRDRRRRRSRSRDRRRRRERTRSRERSSRDKRREYRHESREDVDESSQQSSSSSRWSGRAQRNQPPKPRLEFFNRQQQNQEVPFGPRGATNMNNMRPQFPAPNQNRLSTPVQNTNPIRQSVPPAINKPPQPPVPTSISDAGGIPQPSVSDSIPSSNTPKMSPSQNAYGGFQPDPPVFNPQQMVSYPTFSSSAMGSFNSGFNVPGQKSMPQHQKPGNASEGNSNVQETYDHLKKNINNMKDNKSNLSPSRSQQANSNQTKPNKPESKIDVKPSKASDMVSNDIPLPDNNVMQANNSGFGWGFAGVPNNFGFGNMNPYGHAGYHGQFQQPDWRGAQDNNSAPDKVQNACVQIKNVPPRTTAEDIRAFFRNSLIPTGWLKILGCESNEAEGIVFVRFTSLHDKKQAILRSGCLLNNSIVTVLHVDDSVYENAIDSKTDHNAAPSSGFWNTNTRELPQLPSNVNKKMEHAPDIQNSKQDVKPHNCIKIEGSMRYHPFFTHNHKVYPHVRTICERFKPVDVCVTKAGGQQLNGYVKFDNPDIIENVKKTLANAKIDGKPVTISVCSEEEFCEGKRNCMPLDTQKFLKMSQSHPNKKTVDPKQETKTKPKSGTGFSDPRIKAEESPDEELYKDDVEMKISDNETNVEPQRNKVLLPTPPVMQPQHDSNQMIPTNCILVQNLPYQANDNDILDFFSDIGVIPTQIHIMLDANGKPSGDAFCEFEKCEEANNAACKNNCPMGRNTIFVRLVSMHEMQNALGISIKAPGPPLVPQPGPFFNGPQGPGPGPMYGHMRPDQPPRGDWAPPMFHPSGPPGGHPSGPPDGPHGSESPYDCDYDYEYEDDYQYNSNAPSGRGSGRGGRGFRGRSSDRGGHGRDRGRGSSRGGNFRGGGPMRGMRGGPGGMRGISGRGGERGSRGRGRGGGRGDMSENSRNQPLPLMSLPPGPPMKNNPSQIQLEKNSVHEFGRDGCVVSAENVPYRANVNDILDFFNDFRLTPECVIRRYNDEGKITGDARIAFESPSEARRAIKFLNHKMMGNRKIALSLFK